MVRHYLVTGGAGFIGSNYVARLLRRGEKVTIFDNLSRRGSKINLEWLQQEFGQDTFSLITGDVRQPGLVQQAAATADIIVHLAAQVAVTTSVTEPREDFEVNAFGTFNVLEASRLSRKKPILIYASTNKVYGGMEDVEVVEGQTQYRYATLPEGVPESRGLDFHSPYGCSKGCGDQYVRDYHRIYGIRSVVFRQSCIYGPHQFGMEDQGWVAWFIIATLKQRPVTIFGDGKQVRDILFIDDLLNAYDCAVNRIDDTAGRVYNIGGGVSNTISIWQDFGPILERLSGRPIPVQKGDWRPGDQKIYISDIRQANSELGWKPEVGVEDGIQRLFDWVQANHGLF